MPVASKISSSMEKSSWIRKMFEQGLQLKAQFGEENVFDFSLGNPDVNPPVEFYRVMRELAAREDRGVHGYMPNAGFVEARKAIAAKVSRDQGTEVPWEMVVTSCGAAGGLNVVLKTILNPGDQVLVPKPYFVEYGSYVDNHQGELVTAATNDDFSLNIDAIKKSLGDKTRAVLINSPNNPTGRVYGEGEISALTAVLNDYMKKTGRVIYLISDEPYREIVYDGIKVPGILKHYSQSIVVSSYSKTLSIPGERIGYVAAHPDSREGGKLVSGLILSTRILGFVNSPALMQRVVSRLTGVSVDVDVYQKRRDLLAGGLKSAGYSFNKPEGAFYVFCKSPIADDVEFVKHLQKYNVLVVPGSGFGGPGYFRIAYCVPESVIQRAIPKFKEAFETIQ